MVQESVDRGVRQLSGTPAPAANAMPLQGQYAMPARTAEEVNVAPAASQGQVQGQGLQQGQVNQVNHALANGQMDMFAHLQQAAALADPAAPLGQAPANEPRPSNAPPPAVTQGGLILPQGVQPQQVETQHVVGQDRGTSEWLL